MCGCGVSCHDCGEGLVHLWLGGNAKSKLGPMAELPISCDQARICGGGIYYDLPGGNHQCLPGGVTAYSA
jgi:hypothetical protein